MSAERQYRRASLAGLAATAIAVCIVRWMLGPAADGAIVLSWPDAAVIGFRTSALLSGISIGVALAISGLLLQVLLRNPLASPFILGVSSGAGLGVMICRWAAAMLSSAALATAWGDGAAAVAGAGVALIIVFVLGQRRGAIDPVSLILIGVVVSTVASAGIMFFQHLSPAGVRSDFLRWLMGHIPETAATNELLAAGCIALAGLAISLLIARSMDAAMLGDDEARSVGLSIDRLRIGLFVVAGVLAAMTVAIAGIIGFVGLIAPHIARLVVGPMHRMLVIASALVGIVLVVGADAGRRAVDFGGGVMPIGIITAIIGGPLFIWLLLRDRNNLT